MSDPSAWDALRASDDQATILHDPAFIDIIARTYRCAARPAVIESHRGATGVPAYRVARSVFGRKVTSQPFSFYPTLLGARDELAALQQLIGLAKSEGRRCYAEYKTFTPMAADWIDAVGPLQQVSALVDSELLLAPDDAAQSARYSKGFRQNLRTTRRRATVEGVSLVPASSEGDVRDFYRVLCRNNRDKHHTLTHPLSLYLDFFRTLRPLGKAEFLVAKRSSDVLAGIVVLRTGCRWDYVWGASSEQGRTLGLNTLLVDHMIREALRAKVRVIGFGASSPRDADLLYFKSRWGCQHRPVYYTYWNHAAGTVDLVEGFALARRIFPLVPVTVLAGVAPWVVPLLA